MSAAMPSVEDITAFVSEHATLAGPLIFLVCFGESFAVISLFVPGTAILTACGGLVPSGTLSFWPLLLGAISGAILGDGASFWLGRHFGRQLLRLWPLSRYPEQVARGESFFRKHGGKSVFIGRFFGPVRAIIPLTAGLAQMPPRRFWLANVTSALVWAPLVMLPGALIGTGFLLSARPAVPWEGERLLTFGAGVC